MAVPYEPAYGDQLKITSACVRCGRTVSRRVAPDAVKHYRFHCHHCKRHLDLYPHVEPDVSNGLIEQFVRSMVQHHMSGPVEVFKPGDKGFEKRAQEYLANKREKKKKPAYHYNTFGR